MPSRLNIIGHLDADCFYASAERVRHPKLRNIPVGILGNQGACVIAKSYEMKAYGVKTGVPIWEATKLCPHGVYVKRDFYWYEVLSRKMLECVNSVSPTVEYYSIDEFFFDASYLPQALKGTILEAARALQDLLLKQTGVPISIGLSRSRTLAKLASDHGKPFGCFVLLDPEEIADFVEQIDVREITGIANRSAMKLAAHGIKTCGDFRRADAKLINKLLTKTGEALWWELHGEALTPISTQRPMHKAIARGGSIGESTNDPDRLQAWLVRNVERLVEAMHWHRYVTQRLTVSLSYKEGGHCSERCKLPEASNASELILPVAKHLFERCWLKQMRLSHMHIIADELQFLGAHQRSLFVTHPPRIDAIKRLVNDKFGRFTIRSGETLPLTEIYLDDAHNYDICDVYGKSCF
ncbi:DNA polymerase Y family protein [Thalassoglobus polymorphus]|uniref:DNA polymerase IV n=1 Tax=Thalassoglobus polymorphus TaxID=2527994 RepID=A0A517QLI7_9PLAN|nr:DNA polymerase IV [Thalassoglobus polymorphus]QDT32494.1 DNA polymerase IV [Thalassoglobus polymorphus]